MEIRKLQHPDFIWAWKGGGFRGKVSLWIPYMESISEKTGRGNKDRFEITYNGGSVEFHVKEIDFVMFYGASGDLPLSFLDRLSVFKVPVMIHRRNMPRPCVFFPDMGNDQNDVLTRQILARENEIKTCHIARTLVRHRFLRFSPVLDVGGDTYARLNRARTVDTIRNIEATRTKKYWAKWYDACRLAGTARRDKTSDINKALDAGSFFLYGILLRWILFHRLSPSHGYLHEPTGYPALAYDLMEPYRYIIEDSVMDALFECGPDDGKALVACSLNKIKQFLSDPVYVPATRQTVARKNLLHGVVLALRSYLVGDSRRLVIPVEGEKKGGRPPSVGYLLPGKKMGK